MLQLKYGSSVGEEVGKSVAVEVGTEVFVGSGVVAEGTGLAIGREVAGAQDTRNNIVILVINKNRLILVNSKIILYGERYFL